MNRVLETNTTELFLLFLELRLKRPGWTYEQFIEWVLEAYND